MPSCIFQWGQSEGAGAPAVRCVVMLDSVAGDADHRRSAPLTSVISQKINSNCFWLDSDVVTNFTDNPSTINNKRNLVSQS